MVETESAEDSTEREKDWVEYRYRNVKYLKKKKKKTEGFIIR